MSRVVDQTSVVVPTMMGNMVMHYKLIVEYDVEDVIRAGALSIMTLAQMVNIGEQLLPTSTYPSNTIATAFRVGG